MKKSANVLFLVAFLMFITSCKKDSNDDTTTPTPTPNTSDILWQKELTQAVQPGWEEYMPAVDENDNVYALAGNVDNMNSPTGFSLEAFDANGSTLWSIVNVEATPQRQLVTYYNHKLFVVAIEKLLCYNSQDGSLAWQYDIPDSLETSHNIAMSIVDGNVALTLVGFTASNSHLFLFNTNDGSIITTKPVGPYRSKPISMAANGNMVYVVSDSVYAFEMQASEFNLQWKIQLPGTDNINYTAYYEIELNDVVIANNGNIIFLSLNTYNSNDYLLNSIASDGSINWSIAKSDISRHQIVDASNNIYYSQGDLLKINGSDGNAIWTAGAPEGTMDMGSYNSVILSQNDNLYCGDLFGLYSLDNSGSSRFVKTVSSLNAASFAYANLMSNGNIVLLGSNPDGGLGILYCIKNSDSGAADSWAKWGANAANTFNLAN